MIAMAIRLQGILLLTAQGTLPRLIRIAREILLLASRMPMATLLLLSPMNVERLFLALPAEKMPTGIASLPLRIVTAMLRLPG